MLLSTSGYYYRYVRIPCIVKSIGRKNIWKKRDLDGERPTPPAVGAAPTEGARGWAQDRSAAPEVWAMLREAEDGRVATGQ
jgi:hypothetical protein